MLYLSGFFSDMTLYLYTDQLLLINEIKWIIRLNVVLSLRDIGVLFLLWWFFKVYKKQNLITLLEHLGSPPVFVVGSVLLIFLVFCVVSPLFVFLLCLTCPMLPVSLGYPFFIAPSVFSNVYLQWISKGYNMNW